MANECLPNLELLLTHVEIILLRQLRTENRHHLNLNFILRLFFCMFGHLFIRSLYCLVVYGSFGWLSFCLLIYLLFNYLFIYLFFIYLFIDRMLLNCNFKAVELILYFLLFPGLCRHLTFTDPVQGAALEGHVIRTISIGMYASCKHLCTMESHCLSFNLGPSIMGRMVCELSDSDAIKHQGDLKPREGFVYRGTEVIHSELLSRKICRR